MADKGLDCEVVDLAKEAGLAGLAVAAHQQNKLMSSAGKASPPKRDALINDLRERFPQLSVNAAMRHLERGCWNMERAASFAADAIYGDGEPQPVQHASPRIEPERDDFSMEKKHLWNDRGDVHGGMCFNYGRSMSMPSHKYYHSNKMHRRHGSGQYHADDVYMMHMHGSVGPYHYDDGRERSPRKNTTKWWDLALSSKAKSVQELDAPCSVMRDMLHRGQQIDAFNPAVSLGGSALHSACSASRHPIVDILLQAKADPNLGLPSSPSSRQNNKKRLSAPSSLTPQKGDTPLHIVARMHAIESVVFSPADGQNCVNLLLASGALPGPPLSPPPPSPLPPIWHRLTPSPLPHSLLRQDERGR